MCDEDVWSFPDWNCPYLGMLIILLLTSFLSTAFAYSDEEYQPPAYNHKFAHTGHFRHELRSFGIPTKLAHDVNLDPKAMASAFFESEIGKIHKVPEKERKGFAYRLGRYLDAHRSRPYGQSFRKHKDALLGVSA